MSRTLLVPLLLGALILAELGLGWLRHDTLEELTEAQTWDSDGLRALHVLANRGARPRRYYGEHVLRLLESDDELARDYAMTSDLTRYADKGIQRAHLSELGDHPRAARRRFFLVHQVGSPDLEAVSAYFGVGP